MQSSKPSERRQSLRHHLYHTLMIQVRADAAPRECVLLDISDEGVRIYVVGFGVPDEFVLQFSDVVQERYKVIWRRNGEVGATFISRQTPQDTACPAVVAN
jgi:hypothetical protein